jgi:truncated hemoglobin YjbI
MTSASTTRGGGPCSVLEVSEDVPAIFEWAGGEAAFARWLNAFYDLVEQETELARLVCGRVSEVSATFTEWSSPAESRSDPFAGCRRRSRAAPANLAHSVGCSARA